MTTKTERLQLRIDPQLKKDWDNYCKKDSNARQKIKEFMRSLMSNENKKETTKEENIVTGQNDHGAKKRIELRLTPSEYKAVIKRFDKNDCSIQTWIINSIRASLLNKPQFAMSEVKALWESSSQLRSIGRNLNQITRKFHESDHLDLNKENIQDLSSYIRNHAKRVSGLLDASLGRWKIHDG